MIRALPALLLAACASSNATLLRDLEARAEARPRPDLDAFLESDAAAPPRTALRAFALPLLGGRVPFVDAHLNERRVKALVDTGTSHAALTGRQARDTDLYVPPAPPVEIITPSPHTTHRLGVVESIRLGPFAFGPAQVFVPLADRPGRDYAVLGGAVLSHFRVTFDFRVGEVRFVPHGGPGEAASLFARVRLDGRPYLLLVDSGASGLVLEPWAARELGKPRRLRTVDVAGRRFRDVPVKVADTFKGERDAEGRRPGGLLGLQGFGELVWTLDYGRGLLSVED